MSRQRPYHCPTCQAVRRDRSYCAPRKCLCGHEDCPAFPSYAPLSDTRAPIKVRQTTNTTWDDRTHTTWIDNL